MSQYSSEEKAAKPQSGGKKSCPLALLIESDMQIDGESLLNYAL